jgi:hypothetical protein
MAKCRRDEPELVDLESQTPRQTACWFVEENPGVDLMAAAVEVEGDLAK